MLLVWSFFEKHPKRKLLFRRISLLILLLFSNPLLVNSIFKKVEGEPTAFKDLRDTYSFGVILTGVADIYREPKDRTYFYKGADRATHALQLYKMGKIQNILITGENGLLHSDGTSEAAQLKKFLVIGGVPEERIFLEEKAKNTYQNAMYTQALLQKMGYARDRVLLITSGFHMYRASACFTKAGLDHDSFRVDFHGPPSLFHWQVDRWLLPSANALEKWDILFKEGVGFLAYFVAGYI